MNVVDATGRKVKVGQMVEIVTIGAIQGKVMRIVDSPLIISQDQQINPHLVVVCTLTPFLTQEGTTRWVYITQEPDPKDPMVIEHEQSKKGLIHRA